VKLSLAVKKIKENIDAYMGIEPSEISEATVVSRDDHGNILSIVGDECWETPQLRNHEIKKIYINFVKFKKSNDLEIKSLIEAKTLVLISIFRPSKRTGAYPSTDHIKSLVTNIRRLCDHGNKKGMTFAQLLDNPAYFESYLGKVKSHNLLRVLQLVVGKAVDNSVFSVSTAITKMIDRAIRESEDESEQHPVIPGRILFEKMSNYISLLEEYEANAEKIAELTYRVGLNQFYGRIKKKSPDPKKRNVAFEVAMLECGLLSLQEKYNMTQLSNVGNYLTRCNYAAKMLIHIFTAMRDREAYLLKEGCVEKIGHKTYVMNGLTIKLTKEPRPAKWITSTDILLPYNCALKITNLIKKYIPKCIDTQDLLFLSTSYLPISNEYKKRMVSTELLQGNLGPGTLEHSFPTTIITKEDYQELVMLDPLRNWNSNPEFQVGANWNLTTHQFRRSMAVYAAQSGLVSLPSLKRMLHHTLLQMSIYYTRGFSTAKFLFASANPDLAQFYQSQTVNAEASLFLKDVIMEKVNLHGAAGTWYERNIKDKYLTNIATSFQETLKKVKQGLLSYKETILGGCFKVGECHERAHHNYVACLDCSNACIKEKKLDQSIQIQIKIIDSIPEGTFAYKTELTKLSMLQFFKDKISKVTA
jgi:hypothetical protein